MISKKCLSTLNVFISFMLDFQITSGSPRGGLLQTHDRDGPSSPDAAEEMIIEYLDDNVSGPGNPDSDRICIEDIPQYSSSFLSSLNTYPNITIGNKTHYIDLAEPSWDDQRMIAAREDIGETAEVMEAAKKELVSLLKNDADLNAPWQNDAWLLRFLRARKYKPLSTYKLIRKYYEFKAKNRNIYRDLLPSGMVEILGQECVALLPDRDQLGRRIIVGRADKWKPNEFPMSQMVRLGIVLVELGIYEPITQIAGFQVIVDLKGVSWKQVWSINLNLARKMVDWVLHCIPLRWDKIHIVNEPSWFGLAFKIFKPILTEEIIKALVFHGDNMESLHEYVPVTALPEEYGGSFSMDLYRLTTYEWNVLLKHQDREYEAIDSYGIKKKT